MGFVPFSLIYQLSDTAVQQLNTQASSTYDVSLTLPANTFPGSSVISLLTSSTLSNSVGSSTKDYIFTVERAILWAGFGISIIHLIL